MLSCHDRVCQRPVAPPPFSASFRSDLIVSTRLSRSLPLVTNPGRIVRTAIAYVTKVPPGASPSCH